MRKIRRRSLVGGSLPRHRVYIAAPHFQFILFCFVLWLRCDPVAPCSCHHAVSLLPWQPTMMESYHSGGGSQFLFHKSLLVMLSYLCISKLTSYTIVKVSLVFPILPVKYTGLSRTIVYLTVSPYLLSLIDTCRVCTQQYTLCQP